jgi:hypothetical protein
MKFYLIVVVVLLALAAPVTAQTPTLAWTASDNVATSTEAQSLVYTLYVNNGPAVAVSGVTCIGAAAPFTCSAPVPEGVPTSIGTKVELTAKTGASGESPRSVPFISPPTAPTNLRRQ